MRIFTAMLLSLTMSAFATVSLAAKSGADTGILPATAVVVAQATPSKPAATTQAKRPLTERESFNVTRFVNTCAAYELFLRDFPAGEFEGQARRWMQQKCRSRAGRDATPAAAESTAATPPRKSVSGSRDGNAATVRQKSKRTRKKPRRVQKKKRVVKRKPATSRPRRPRPRRCRRETNLECIKRGGQIELGSCLTTQICE